MADEQPTTTTTPDSVEETALAVIELQQFDRAQFVRAGRKERVYFGGAADKSKARS